MKGPTEKEVLKLTQLLDRHSVSNQELLASFYEFCSSEHFDPTNQRFLDLQAAVTQFAVKEEEQNRTIEEVKDVLRYLLNKVQDLEAEVKDTKTEVEDMKRKAAEQEYLRLLREGIFEVRCLVAMALGLETWSSLAAKLFLEKHSPQKPWRAKIAAVLQSMGLDLPVWDSFSQLASERSDYCHPGSSVSSSYLYQLAMNSQAPASIAAHRPDLVKAMSFLKDHNKGL